MAVSTYDFILAGGTRNVGSGSEAIVTSNIIGSSSLIQYKLLALGNGGTSIRVTDIVEAPDSNLIIGDYDGIYKYNKALSLVTSFGNSGSADFNGASVNPLSWDIDSSGNIYAYSNSPGDQLYKINSSGNYVNNVTPLADGVVYVDDSDNVFTAYEDLGGTGRMVNVLASDLSVAEQYMTETSGFDAHAGMMVFGGYIYLVGYDSGGTNGFRLYTEEFVIPDTASTTQTDLIGLATNDVDFVSPKLIRHSSNGDFYAVMSYRSSDGHDVFRFETDGTLVASAHYSGDAGSSAHARCIKEDPDGNIWVGGEVDSNGNVLKKFDSDLSLLGAYDLGSEFTGAGAEVTCLYFYTGPLSYAVYPDDLRHTKKLVAFGNNEVWYESTAGTMTELSEANGELDMTGALQAFEGFQKVFVANNSLKYVADFNNTRLRVTANIDSTTVRDTVLRNSDNAQMVVDYVDNLGGSGMVYGRTITADAFVSGEDVYNTSLGISFAVNSVKEAPLWYEWTPYADDSATYGSLPDKATLGCLWRGRPVLAGNPNYPFQWYMGRVANPWDWAYTANDALTPVAGGNADAGEIGDHVTALIPYNDDYLIFGCLNSVWVMRGDPAYGGQLDIVTLSTGVYGAKAWTWDTDGNLFFFGTGGLYLMPKGFGAVRNLSQNSLPELIDDNTIDPSEYRIVLGYDPRRNGVLLAITKVETGENQNYWYDLRTGGFYPETYSTLNAVYCSHYYESQDDDYRRLLLGCANGYISYFKDTLKNDNAADILGNTYTAIESKMLLPIMPLGDGEDTEGRLTTLTIRTSGGKSSGTFTDTDGMDYEVYVGDSAEEVLEDVEDEATPLVSGTLTGPGRKKRIRNKAKGMNAGIMIKNLNSTETWSIEKVTGVRKPSGRNKR